MVPSTHGRCPRATRRTLPAAVVHVVVRAVLVGRLGPIGARERLLQLADGHHRGRVDAIQRGKVDAREVTHDDRIQRACEAARSHR